MWRWLLHNRSYKNGSSSGSIVVPSA
jgi:hypothetical protein